MNKIYRKLHLWLAVPTGILISVICLSGAALVFEQDITQALNLHLYRSEPQTKFLQPSEIAARIREQMPDSLSLSSLQMPGEADGVCMASFKNAGRRTLSVNPYTGDVNGWTKSYPFFQTMRKLHRWLMNPPAQKGEKSVGKVVVGITTLVMVFILVSGLIVWIPRNRKALKNRLKVSYSKGWRRFWYDSHVSLGFYATIFLLIMALTGLTWSFGWYRTAAYSLFGGGQQQTSAPGKANGKQTGKKQAFDYNVWDNVFHELQNRYPAYQNITLAIGNAQVSPYPHSSMRKTDRVTFNQQTGEIKKITRYKELPPSQTLKGWFYAVHTGSWGGMITKILYFIATLIGGVLPLSGYYLWMKRKHYI